MKWFKGIAILFGFVFLVYGWTQSWVFEAPSEEFDRILIERTVRTYAFIIGGIIFLFIGVFISVIDKHLLMLEALIYENRN